MAIATPRERESADQLLGRPRSACKRAGFLVEVIEPAARLKISTPNGSDLMAETITLKTATHLVGRARAVGDRS
jgi:hypothetical protein